jgi:hypothetical protein
MLETANLVVFVLAEQVKTRLPVRSALFKQRTGRIVVRWVTTSEYPLLYVFYRFFSCLRNDLRRFVAGGCICCGG